MNLLSELTDAQRAEVLRVLAREGWRTTNRGLALLVAMARQKFPAPDPK